MRFVSSFGVLVVLLCSLTAQDRSIVGSQRQRDDYSTWVEPYREAPFQPFLRSYLETQVWFTVSADECQFRLEPRSSTAPPPCSLPTNTCQVSSTGMSVCEHVTCCPGAGGGYSHLEPETFEELQNLIAELPDDLERLPTSGRRFLVQVLRNGRIDVRVYDTQSLPQDVKQVLALIGMTIPALNSKTLPQSLNE